MTAKKTVSIIVPLCNQEKTLPILFQRLDQLRAELQGKHTCEFILVNDGSSDGSWDAIEHYVIAHNDTIGITFSRNFGHQAVLKAGYDTATGDGIITMDVSVQNPSSLISSMIKLWENGSDIVYVRSTDCHSSLLQRRIASWFYALLDRVAEVAIPRGVGEFRLIDRKVLKVVLQSSEQSPYFKGMVAWTGFKQAYVAIDASDQLITSQESWSTIAKHVFDGMTSFSLFPLRLAAFFGIFVILTGCLMFLYISIDALFFKIHYPLFKWLVTIVYICMGIQFMLLWIIGEYVGRIYDQEKNRPLYVVDKVI